MLTTTTTPSRMHLPPFLHCSHVIATTSNTRVLLVLSCCCLQGPRCSIRSKKMYSDATPDYLRMTALNLPAALLVLGFLFSIDDITGRGRVDSCADMCDMVWPAI